MKHAQSRSQRTVRVHVAHVGLLATLACSGPSDKDIDRITPPPGPPAFNVVADALQKHCGTLDCHGNNARNMRLFGYYGIRQFDKDRVNFTATTPAEYEMTYQSVITIDPERLSRIVASGGAGIDKWLVLSKGRGTEHHKGGARLAPGGAADTCLVSWVLARSEADSGPGIVNAAACVAAANLVPPGEDWGQTPQ